MIPGIKSVLYATDLSENSGYSFRHATYVAKLTGADLHVLHVVEPLSDDAKTAFMLFLQDEKQRREAFANRLEQARTQLREFQDRFWAQKSADDLKVRDQIKTLEIVEGAAAEEILKHAKKHACDLIVLGSDQHGISHTFLGTTAKRVLRRSRIPTLIVPTSEDA
jgi:nucleotide-binding universal stress UspA family protein